MSSLHSLGAAWVGFTQRGGSNANERSASAHWRTIRPRSSERSDWSTAPDLTTAVAEREPIRGASAVCEWRHCRSARWPRSVGKRSRDTGTERTESVIPRGEQRDGATRGWTPPSSWRRWTRACPSWATSSRWGTSTVREGDDAHKQINNTDVILILRFTERVLEQTGVYYVLNRNNPYKLMTHCYKYKLIVHPVTSFSSDSLV